MIFNLYRVNWSVIMLKFIHPSMFLSIYDTFFTGKYIMKSLKYRYLAEKRPDTYELVL